MLFHGAVFHIAIPYCYSMCAIPCHPNLFPLKYRYAPMGGGSLLVRRQWASNTYAEPMCMQPRSLGPTDQATTSHARVASLDVYTPPPPWMMWKNTRFCWKNTRFCESGIRFLSGIATWNSDMEYTKMWNTSRESRAFGNSNVE